MDKPKILITGGSGFLGSHIVKELSGPEALLQPSLIRVFDIKDFAGEEQVDFVKADIRHYDDVRKACEGMDAVIHCAAIIDWGTHSPQEVYDVNVGGTGNVIRACRELGIGYLVFTSSLDAVYSGKPLRNIDDSQPYPAKYHNMYCRSKVFGEQMVKKATDGKLKTVILRPSDIYGPADPYHMNALISMAKTGFYVRLGNGRAKAQHVFAGNMAHAHVLALKALFEGNEKVTGQAYLMTDGPSSNFFSFFDQIVIRAGYRYWPRNLWIPRGPAYAMGTASEFIALLVRPFKRYNPGLSRFAVNYTCTDFTFDSERAREHFGFVPKYTEEEAIALTAEYYRKGKQVPGTRH
jgi:sterol-4alpha-carboxylate 3-dehydrogenase (decarboxylating)